MTKASLAPLPDMQTCSWCHRLGLGFERASEGFVCAECWAEHSAKLPPEMEIVEECHCAGCGAPLPASEAIVVDLFEPDLRCDLCWRAMLAAEAAHDRQRQSGLLAPLLEELAAVARARASAT